MFTYNHEIPRHTGIYGGVMGGNSYYYEQQEEEDRKSLYEDKLKSRIEEKLRDDLAMENEKIKHRKYAEEDIETINQVKTFYGGGMDKKEYSKLCKSVKKSKKKGYVKVDEFKNRQEGGKRAALKNPYFIILGHLRDKHKNSGIPQKELSKMASEIYNRKYKHRYDGVFPPKKSVYIKYSEPVDLS